VCVYLWTNLGGRVWEGVCEHVYEHVYVYVCVCVISNVLL
jgi:hypothetical protein